MDLHVSDVARICHEANRALQLSQNEKNVSEPWLDLDDHTRFSAIDGVQKALEGATPEELHEHWCLFKLKDGWTHGHVKDAKAKTHPCLVPYAELPRDQRRKDWLFSAIVEALKNEVRS